jgi:hypothetical protein
MAPRRPNSSLPFSPKTAFMILTLASQIVALDQSMTRMIKQMDAAVSKS